ncbi:MAG: sulfatase-like hydrolase/transferase [Pigmentiphaga sp.]|nr:sulfatase-like hydrolase/transferase [Pigmentiphaga sp.]
MKHQFRYLTPLIVGSTISSLTPNVFAKNTPKPNLVFVFVDDLGWGTFAPNLKDFTKDELNQAFIEKHAKDYTAEEAFEAIELAMPNLTRYCEEGARFTNAYTTANVSSPSRAGMLTSSYQQRYGIYINKEGENGIPENILTMPQVLKKSGYVNGVFGKYHNGKGMDKLYTCSPGHHPLDRGFDEFFGFNLHGTTYYDSPILFKNRENVSCSTYTTDKFTSEAVQFIKQNEGKPKFIYLPYNAVHGPLGTPAPENYMSRFHYKSKRLNIYAAYIAAVDEGVNRVMETLKQQGELDNTMLVFMSDNGAPGAAAATLPKNGPFAGFKGQVFEGGTRVPMFFWFGEKIKKGTVNNQVVSSMDVFPTFFDAAGVLPPTSQKIDGKSLLPILSGKSTQEVREYLVWMHQQAENWGMNNIKDQNTAKASYAVRKNNFVLRYILEDNQFYLFDLSSDRQEQSNLSTKYPAKTNELKKIFKQWFSEMKKPIFWKPELWQGINR